MRKRKKEERNRQTNVSEGQFINFQGKHTKPAGILALVTQHIFSLTVKSWYPIKRS